MWVLQPTTQPGGYQMTQKMSPLRRRMIEGLGIAGPLATMAMRNSRNEKMFLIVSKTGVDTKRNSFAIVGKT
jgi:hypothetical protein